MRLHMNLKEVNDGFMAALTPVRVARHLPNDVRARRRNVTEEAGYAYAEHLRDVMRRPSLTTIMFGEPDVPVPMPRRKVIYGRVVTVHLPCGRPRMERRTPGVQVAEDGTFIEKTE